MTFIKEISQATLLSTKHTNILIRGYATSKNRKVAILGAAGGIGQPLALLLKANPTMSHLSLFDISNVGMAADLSHISTPCKVTGHSGDAELPAALEGANYVLIPAGVPRKPGMTRDDLFSVNASIVRNLSLACAKHCPQAQLLIISNPVNSTVPIAYETLKANGVSRPNVFGVTTLDIVRARTFVGQLKGVDPTLVKVPVIGGHSGITIVPLLSQCTINGKPVSFTEDEIKELTKRIQFGGDEVVKAKAGTGSATLSMAYAADEFYRNMIAPVDKPSVTARIISYVKRDVAPSGSALPNEYFAAEVSISGQGVSAVAPLPQMSPFEQDLYKAAVAELEKDIKKGEDFARGKF